MTTQGLTNLLASLPEFRDRLDSIITEIRAFDVFRRIADTYAPTLTVSRTRAPVLKRILDDAMQEGLYADEIDFTPSCQGTGVAVARLGSEPRSPVWSVAHLDNISFLTGPGHNGVYPLTPFCQSRLTPGERPAVALDLADPDQPARIVASGHIATAERSPGSLEPEHRFVTDCADLPLATRVCFASTAEWDRTTGMVYGCIDNAACASAQLLAALVVRPYRPNVNILWTDEEEGVVDMGPPTFARAASRLVLRTPLDQMPELVFVSDIQDLDFAADVDVDNPACFGRGAAMEAFTSRTRGTATPPLLLGGMRKLFAEMETIDVRVLEQGRYLNRNDDVAMTMATPNIVHLCCPGAFTHFQGRPRVHVADIVHLAKALACLWMVTHSDDWRANFTRCADHPGSAAAVGPTGY